MAFLKPQNPMTKGSDYFYPLTTADQVIMDGGYRLDEIVGKTKKSTIMLYANGWSAEAPYCYSVTVQGLSDKVNMKMLPHFPEDFEGKQAMKEETAKISFATREGNILTFECWDEVPTMDLPIDIEIDAMYPIKGASIEMNYSVVGGIEEPAEPAENMIWVNTDQDITDWVFSKNEPKNPEEGMIWFATGDNSNVSFFTLRMDRREFDEVYPISAKQYVGSKWDDVTAMIYQGGEWAECIADIILVKNGVPSAEFVTAGITENSDSTNYPDQTKPILNTSEFVLNISGSGTLVCTSKLIVDLTAYSKITLRGTSQRSVTSESSTKSAKLMVSLVNDNGTSVASGSFTPTSMGSLQEFLIEIDVSALKGSHNMQFSFTRDGNYGATTTFMTISFTR